jgi:hypothetical protein
MKQLRNNSSSDGWGINIYITVSHDGKLDECVSERAIQPNPQSASYIKRSLNLE